LNPRQLKGLKVDELPRNGPSVYAKSSSTQPLKRDCAVHIKNDIVTMNVRSVHPALYAQTPLIRFVVDLLYNFSICCGLVDFMGLGVT